MRKYIDYLNGGIVVIMFLTIFAQIVGREILKVATSWSVETSIILFVFVVFLGTASTTRERTHLRVDFLYNLFPAWLKRVTDVVCGVAYIVFFVAFSYGAYRNIGDNWAVEIPTIEWFRWGYVYLVVFLATLINIGYLAINLVEDTLGTGNKV